MSDVIVMGSGATPALRHGRLFYALDATASREPTWNIARDLQSKMFREATSIGRLDMQLVYYRGGDECRASRWVSSGDDLAAMMNKITCDAGMTQIGRVLKHILRENEKVTVQSAVFIGDACEEAIDPLAGMASALGKAGVPLNMFQEGRDENVRRVFRMLALRSGGAFCEFNANSSRAIDQLSEQLNAAARLAVSEAPAIAHTKQTEKS
jgi:hypothetical protein